MIKQSITKLAILIAPCLLLLTACGSQAPRTDVPITPQDNAPTSAPSTPTRAPDTPPAYEGCAFMWASRELPDFSKKINEMLQAVDANISASAYAYGENCVYANGDATFSAMETDYRVKAQVRDLKDEAALGDLIAKVMSAIVKIPLGDVAGPNPGRVEFSFQHGNERVAVNIQISQYTHDAGNLKGAELFRFFHNNP